MLSALWPGSVGTNLTVSPGETVALVGPSGAGKSTVFQLLLRFHDPDAGRVTLDGRDLREVDPAALRRQVALVPQDPMIFGASARENIRYGRLEASDADIGSWFASEPLIEQPLAAPGVRR